MRTIRNYKQWLVLLVVVLCGCQQINEKRSHYVRNRDNDYLKSTTIAPLQVPEDLSQLRANETFPLPEDPPRLGTLKPAPLTPPGFGVLAS